LGFSQKVTNGTKVVAETFRFFTEGDEETGNPCETGRFFYRRERTQGKSRPNSNFTSLPEFFTEGNGGNEGRSGPSKIQSLFSSLSSV
jgi:hypothetical protein